MSKGGSSQPAQAAIPTMPGLPQTPTVLPPTPMQPFQPAQGGAPMPTPNFAPPPVTATTTIYDQSAQNMAQATNNIAGGTGLIAAGATPIAAGMGMYQNPFENQVMNQFQNDLGRQTAIQQTRNQAAAANAGAFGGSRHGLVEAQTNEAAQRNLGTFSANLRNQGFNQMANLSNQDIQNRMAAGQGLFAGAGLSSGIAGQQFGMGQDIANQQFQQGALQQGMNQMLLDQARQMFQQYTNQPLSLLDLRSQVAANSPLNRAVTTSTAGTTTGAGTNTSSYTPGLFDYLSLGANMAGTFMAPGG